MIKITHDFQQNRHQPRPTWLKTKLNPTVLTINNTAITATNTAMSELVVNTFTRVQLSAEANGSTRSHAIRWKWIVLITPSGNIWKATTRFVSQSLPTTPITGWPLVSLKQPPWYIYSLIFTTIEKSILINILTYFHIGVFFFPASNGRCTRLGRSQWPRLCRRLLGRRLHGS